MAIISNKETTTKTQLTNAAEFSIQADSALYAVLTKNIYTDTILAPIRELSTNAVDACLEADLPVNFDVHLPTIEEPTFSVRDYGLGLTQEDLLGLFCTVGASTKRDSNLYNGQFGLGRLAPLAYTNAFTVESFKDGNYYSYLISIQNGIPVSSELATSTTAEPNGLRLSLAVDIEDIRHFTGKAQSLYRYFDHKPKLNIELDITLPESDFVSDNWSISSRSNSLVMSNVVYHIPNDSKLNKKGFTQILLHCPTGSVSINPGRESLSLDQPTIDYLNKRFEDAANEYVEIANDAILEQSTLIGKFKAYSRMRTASPSSEISSLLLLPTTTIFDKQLTATDRHHSNTKYIRPSSQATIQFKIRDSYSSTNRKLENTYMNIREFYTSSFVIVDTKTRFNDAIKAIQAVDNSKCLILLQRPVNTTLENFVADATEFCEDLSVIPYLTSNYTSERISTTSNRSNSIYVCKNYYGEFRAGVQASSTQNYVYVPLTGYKCSIPNLREWRKFVEYLNSYHNYNKQFVGIQKKYIKDVEKSSNFTPLLDELPQKLKSMNFVVRKHNETKGLNWNKPKIAPQCILNHYQEAETISIPDTAISEGLFDKFKLLDPSISCKVVGLTHTVADLQNKYPLLHSISIYDGQDDFEYYMKLEHLNEQNNPNLLSE